MTAGRVVLDTNIASAVVLGRDPALLERYQDVLRASTFVIPLHVLTEIRYGYLKAAWGRATQAETERRLQDHELWLPGDAATRTCAGLRDACRRAGHPLHEKAHDADRWIATAALDLGLPLVSHDRIFREAPGLQLVCRA